jgi:pseudaminic acid cytidylyltransferase
MIVAVIPARGGSKRIPRKNIRAFAGRPIIAYSILAARECGVFDRVIVSTDDEEIATVAREWGAETPFRRSPVLADDHTGTNAVVADALNRLIGERQVPVFACCIYATAPFIRPTDLRTGYEILKSTGKDFVLSATSYAFPVQRAFRLLPSGGIAPFDENAMKSRSQDWEPAYHDAAQFYWGTVAAFVEGRPIFSANAEPVILPRHRVCDIDTIEDWTYAEFLHSAVVKSAESDR